MVLENDKTYHILPVYPTLNCIFMVIKVGVILDYLPYINS